MSTTTDIQSTVCVTRGYRGQAAWLLLRLIPAILAAMFSGCGRGPDREPVKEDEAMLRARAEGKTPKQAAYEYFYPRYVHDYFPGMDSVSRVSHPDQLLDRRPATVADEADGRPAESRTPAPEELNESEILGRNTWMIWCAGNEGFWDWLATENLGFIDLLKLVDSRNRATRFRDAGIINEPAMSQATAPMRGEFGLWLDTPADERTRTWRRAYLESTFQEIAEGRHKSQRGLPVFRGDLDALPDDGAYDSPERYVRGRQPNGAGDYAADGQGDTAYQVIPPPDIYGLSSGVVGLRLFPNPNFDAEARNKWDAARYYNDASYFDDPDLVRPFRVGMSCAFCHASFHPLKPPRDVANPEWANISGNIGAQYLRVRAAFGNLLTERDFVYHLLDSQPPGTIDTSLIASDNINNPNTMNAVFNLPQRAVVSLRNPRERLSAASDDLPSIWRHPEVDAGEGDPDPVPEDWRTLFDAHGLSEELENTNANPRRTPRILLDGADSIGAWGAFARVYLNIGTYYERWNQLHQPLLGFQTQRPFTISDCDRHSVYWNATALRVDKLRDYFLKVTPPMPLLSTIDEAPLRALAKQDAAGETDSAIQTATEERRFAELLSEARAEFVDISQLAHGRQVFARNCIVCHSSIQPESSAFTLHPGSEADEGRRTYETRYKGLIEQRLNKRAEWARAGEVWEHDPGQWLRNPDYLRWAEEIVEKPDFWRWNYLSTDYRIPITVVETNAGRAMATNALTGHMWEDFSSQSYRELPSVGPIAFFNPYGGPSGRIEQFTPRHLTAPGVPAGGGGPGFYRVPTLVSIWATAPFLHNNSLGKFNNDPSVDGRLTAFDDAIRKLLWPERRLESSSYNGATPARLKQDRGLIWRTTADSYLTIKGKYVPNTLRMVPAIGALSERFPWLARVSPLWLPSVLLLAGGWLVLLVSNAETRRRRGWTLLALALVAWGAITLAHWRPGLPFAGWLRAIDPSWLPGLILGLIAIILLLPLSPKWTRFGGYFVMLLAVVLGGFVYFKAGRLGDLSIGPIPKGTPVNLVANFNPEADRPSQLTAISEVLSGLAEIDSRHLSRDDTQHVLREQIAPALLKVNKCPDFVMDRGHDFPWFQTMTDEDKEALIELLKTF